MTTLKEFTHSIAAEITGDAEHSHLQTSHAAELPSPADASIHQDDLERALEPRIRQLIDDTALAGWDTPVAVKAVTAVLTDVLVEHVHDPDPADDPPSP
ncbi:hypothetical protein [Pararhizobium sp.]|uniref:hypothetical protein n=1 Tax=Pararhizobium sp. TaxID=1977563 RepID=UPI0027188280|nr:hypothetical protein [Pararhizobium sp.]MDO9416881.1 hypothetical protein [Pararhizobium sp.]